MTANSDTGMWYYVVDCATCKEPILFKQAPSSEDEPIMRFPTMRVRCPRCRSDDTYAGELISRRQITKGCESWSVDAIYGLAYGL
jgi:DNA-directed RNA polymerase subunit RPC12/RpoP